MSYNNRGVLRLLYQSTRGSKKKISFEEAIIKGIADDGGLYVPEHIPKVSMEFIASLADMSYAGAAAEIVKLFAENYTEQEIRDCTERAYNERSFTAPEVTPLCALCDSGSCGGGGGVYGGSVGGSGGDNGDCSQINVMELYHGPTAAFKDVALQLLPPMLTLALQKTGVKESIAILVATSGDTGKAALEGFRDVPGTAILVFYPKDGVSEAQKLQMITQEGGNVAVAAVEGNFDDAQNGVKAIFGDVEANKILREKGILLSSANSINWGRLLPQIVYYFKAYATLLKRYAIDCAEHGEQTTNIAFKNGDPICFVVPTGNFGNILAGWYAREMGLPVSRFICASNSNNVLADFINTGVYNKNRDFMVTISPAMDILISSNMERLLFELSGRDSESVANWMKQLVRTGSYDVGGAMREKLAGLFYGGYATEVETARAVSDTYNRYHYIIDTHTAVGMHVYSEYLKTKVAPSGEIVVLAATASPYKFAKDVYKAINRSESAVDEIPVDDDIEYIDLLSKIGGGSCAPVPESLRDLRAKPVLHLTETKQEDMKETALKILAALVNKSHTEGQTFDYADNN